MVGVVVVAAAGAELEARGPGGAEWSDRRPHGGGGMFGEGRCRQTGGGVPEQAESGCRIIHLGEAVLLFALETQKRPSVSLKVLALVRGVFPKSRETAGGTSVSTSFSLGHTMRSRVWGSSVQVKRDPGYFLL